MASTWTQRTSASHETGNALGYLTAIIQRIDPSYNAPNASPAQIRPDRFFITQTEITAVGGIRPSCLHAIEQLLSTWYHAPLERNESILDGELHGLHLRYANGIIINYLLHRDNGISVTIPKSVAHSLADHVSAAQSELSKTKAQSTIAM